MKDPNAVTRYSLNKEYYLEYERTRRTPEYRQRQKIYQKNYYMRHRDRILAHQRVMDPIRRPRKGRPIKEVKEAAAAAAVKVTKEKKVKKSEVIFYEPEATPTYREAPISFTESDWA
jgi:hypothetical protein